MNPVIQRNYFSFFALHCISETRPRYPLVFDETDFTLQKKFRNAQSVVLKARAFRYPLEEIYESYEESFLVCALQSVPTWSLLAALKSALHGCEPVSDFAEELWRLYRILCFLTSDLLDNILGPVMNASALLDGYRPCATGAEYSFYERIHRLIRSSERQLETVCVKNRGVSGTGFTVPLF